MKDLPYLRSISLGYSVFCGTRKNSLLVSMKGIILCLIDGLTR